MTSRLGERRLRAVLDLVGEVYGARDMDELRTNLLVGISHAVPASFLSYNEVHDETGPVFSVIEPDVAPEFYAAWARLAHQNPLIARYEQTRDGRAYRFSDVLTARQLHGLDVYREFYAPLGVEHQIAFTLPAPRRLTIGLALSRTADQGDFTDAERAMLDLARPHLAQAFRHVRDGVGPPEARALQALGLTPREADVLRSFAAGRSGPETAAALGIAPGTVRVYAASIHTKLGVRTRAQAVAVAHGLRRSS